MIKNSRRRVPNDPTAYVNWPDARREEMAREADAQAELNGLDPDTHRDLLSAIVWQECAERAGGDPTRTRMLFELELEGIQQNQTRDALEEIKGIITEAAAEAVSGNYVTAAQAEL